MTLWLGIMRIAEAAGLVTLLGRALRPVLRWLFPEVPAGPSGRRRDRASRIAANMLGLNNAATPLGIKAMEELQDAEPATRTPPRNPMVTFMAMTTSGVQLIPATMIGVLAAAGSQQSDRDHRARRSSPRSSARSPAVIAAKLLQRVLSAAPAAASASGDGRMIRAALERSRSGPCRSCWSASRSSACIRKVKVYDVFIEGAKEGFEVAVKIIPFLVGILVAIGMFRGSGAMDLLTAGAAARSSTATGFPGGALPAGDPALADRQRLAGVHDRPHQDPRPRLADRAHGRDDVRLVGDDVLRACRRTSARSACAARGTPCRRR